MKHLGRYAAWGMILIIVLAGISVAACQPCPPCPPCPEVTPAATCAPTATVEPTATPVPQRTVLWEPYLSEINASFTLVPAARYELVAMWHTENGQWDPVPAYARPYITVNGGGAETHAFAIVYNKDGSPLVGKNVLLTWPGGEQGGITWDDGSVNFFTPGKYYPDQSVGGPYCVQVLKGDSYCGAGLPYARHVSIFGVWRERADYAPTILEWLGITR